MTTACRVVMLQHTAEHAALTGPPDSGAWRVCVCGGGDHEKYGAVEENSGCDDGMQTNVTAAYTTARSVHDPGPLDSLRLQQLLSVRLACHTRTPHTSTCWQSATDNLNRCHAYATTSSTTDSS
eukprot:GDKI01020490.1.p1 GENE.GDKI01020490.1~~GDKI01020490.1.p1  ORF type:complete len:124 (+),score=35.42 GDKI01020490.1:210-581(+)